jgi:hypothetical protein
MILGISSLSCFTRNVTPFITYSSLSELTKGQPNCGEQYLAVFADPAEDKVLEALKCDSYVIDYYRNEYQAVEVQLDVIYNKTGQ